MHRCSFYFLLIVLVTSQNQYFVQDDFIKPVNEIRELSNLPPLRISPKDLFEEDEFNYEHCLDFETLGKKTNMLTYIAPLSDLEHVMMEAINKWSRGGTSAPIMNKDFTQITCKYATCSDKEHFLIQCKMGSPEFKVTTTTKEPIRQEQTTSPQKMEITTTQKEQTTSPPKMEIMTTQKEQTTSPPKMEIMTTQKEQTTSLPKMEITTTQKEETTPAPKMEATSKYYSVSTKSTNLALSLSPLSVLRIMLLSVMTSIVL